MEVGDEIKFKSEKQKYIIQATNGRFSICTKPFNPKKTVLYTIIDWENGNRGPENLVFGMGAETKQDCDEMLERLEKGESEISSRRYCELDIEWVKEYWK